MSNVLRYYWDTSVFCSYLNEEPNFKVVEDLLKEGHAARLEIVTSSFTLTEVLKLKGHVPITEDKEKELQTFFEYPFIKFIDANRFVCERARRFVWKHGCKPKDAVHIASAEVASKITTIHGLFAWDEDFVKLDGKLGLPFPISHPYIQQGLLNLETEQKLEGNDGDGSN